ncbi:hypothetical protein Rsub_01995 [Raphidocelis subcapitata]|uniref:Transmembrane protein 107 n=1 Tax=Raphidocelis subcapitata TaxID=307507 RepID=A0A2V0NV38_9CHLO|nr:hypothetical protein Rsub_01995 [Raphidocelis subcapitata]|eukprot:GBF89423.1 hypothetical protein Rsub_01995 [Raphidocelis subcapitata]
MGFMRSEEVTLPMRFLVTTAHLIAVVTLLFDLDALTAQVVLTEGSEFALTRQRLRGLAAASLACFGVEYLGLFAGASIFMRGHTLACIVLHFLGAVVTALFYARAWAVGAFAAAAALFSYVPATIEALTLLYVLRVSAYSY